MTKILYVITKSNFGGAQRYVYELATNLPKEDFKAEVALGGDGALKTELEKAHIPIHQIDGAARDVSFLMEIKVLINLYKIIKKVGPDIVHLNSSKMGGLGAIAARLAGVKKIIFTNHGWAFKEPRPHWQTSLIKFLSWITIISCHLVIVLSEKERLFVRSWPFASKKLRVIPNGLLAFEILPRDKALTELVGVEMVEKIKTEKIRVVGTIAELTKNKGLIYAIEGMALLNDARTIFIIIGEGEDRSLLEQAIMDADLGDQVFLTGRAENARACLSAFDFFILPSLKEGLPYAILEAGFAKLPVIATNVGGIPEIITNLEHGLILSPRRPQEIKHALIYMEEHPHDAKKFAENLRHRIDTFYSFDRMLNSTKNLYIGE